MICDPPALQISRVDIQSDYQKILRRVPELMNPGGQLMLCLNSPRLDEGFLHTMVAEICPACRFVEAISPPAVYVDAVARSGLKVLVFEYGG